MRFCLAVTVIAFAAGVPAQTRYSGPRTADGKPEINGIWQSLNTADWDLLPHAAAQGPVLALGAAGAQKKHNGETGCSLVTRGVS